MSFPNYLSALLDFKTVSIIPTYSSVTNPTFLFYDGTSGIYNNSTSSIIFL